MNKFNFGWVEQHQKNIRNEENIRIIISVRFDRVWVK